MTNQEAFRLLVRRLGNFMDCHNSHCYGCAYDPNGKCIDQYHADIESLITLLRSPDVDETRFGAMEYKP